MVHSFAAKGDLRCHTCNSLYWITVQKILVRDQDSITCSVCKEPLIKWSGSTVYHAELREAEPWPR